MVGVRDLLRNGQTHVQPGGMMGDIGRGERRKDMREIRRIDASAPIGHPHRAMGGLPGDLHVDLPARWTKPHSTEFSGGVWHHSSKAP
jgi:hypothetical protein